MYSQAGAPPLHPAKGTASLWNPASARPPDPVAQRYLDRQGESEKKTVLCSSAKASKGVMLMSNKRKPARLRNRAVTVRMTEEEYRAMKAKVEESGLPQQTYIIEAVTGSPIIDSSGVKQLLAVWKENSRNLSDLVRQIKGLGTNVNQMAHIANGQGYLPAVRSLDGISEKLDLARKEAEKIWRSTRLLISQQNHMEQ